MVSSVLVVSLMKCIIFAMADRQTLTSLAA